MHCFIIIYLLLSLNQHLFNVQLSCDVAIRPRYIACYLERWTRWYAVKSVLLNLTAVMSAKDLARNVIK